jgi:hypothetical protein
MRNCRSNLGWFCDCLVRITLVLAFPISAFGQIPSNLWEGHGQNYDVGMCNQAALDSITPQRFDPVFGFDVGAIWLSRTTPDSQNLVFDQNANVLSNANQLKGSMGDGLDASLSFYNVFRETPVDVQMRFFQASDMTAEQTLTATQVIPLFYNGIPANPTNSNDLFYQTQIRSFEANAVYRTPFRVRFLTGVRWFEVDEIYDITDNVNSANGVIVGTFSRAENTMLGGQVGAEGTVISNDNGRVFGSFKWAFLGNDAFGAARATNAASGALLEAVAKDSISSQLLDFQLGGALGLSRRFSVYAGYQGLVASDLSLALNQNDNASIFAGTNPIFRSDGQWHGFKLNLVSIW